MLRSFIAISGLVCLVSIQAQLRLTPQSCLPKCLGTQVQCFADPCLFAEPCQANVTCVADYCDGCHARFYDDDCNEVSCSAASLLVAPQHPQSCAPQCDNPVNCFVDPCQFSTPCEAQAGLTCVSDYCGGCNARYYDDNCNEVKCTSPQDCAPQCDNPVNCLVDPCQVSTPCEAQAGLECVSDYCGGCNARYYDDNCNEVKCTSPQDCAPQCDNPVNCFVDPCQFSSPCPAQAGLECVSDYCGGCHARYYDDNCNEVECHTPLPQAPNDCLPACLGNQVQCFVDPCQFSQCPTAPNATCVSDYCDGCNARYYDDNCNEISCFAAS